VIPFLAAEPAQRDRIVPPDNGCRVQMCHAVVPFCVGTRKDGGFWDAGPDVRDERGEAESDEGQPFGEVDIVRVVVNYEARVGRHLYPMLPT